MVMLREVLPEKLEDPAPELDMMLICAVAEGKGTLLSQAPVAAEKERRSLSGQRCYSNDGRGSMRGDDGFQCDRWAQASDRRAAIFRGLRRMEE
jgi:hypothetical protein